MPTTLPSCFLWSKPSLPLEESPVDRVGNRKRSRATADTIPNPIEKSFAKKAYNPSWPNGALKTAADWAGTAGWWNERCRGCINIDDFEFDLKDAPIFTKRSFLLDVR